MFGLLPQPHESKLRAFLMCSIFHSFKIKDLILILVILYYNVIRLSTSSDNLSPESEMRILCGWLSMRLAGVILMNVAFLVLQQDFRTYIIEGRPQASATCVKYSSTGPLYRTKPSTPSAISILTLSSFTCPYRSALPFFMEATDPIPR